MKNLKLALVIVLLLFATTGCVTLGQVADGGTYTVNALQIYGKLTTVDSGVSDTIKTVLNKNWADRPEVLSVIERVSTINRRITTLANADSGLEMAIVQAGAIDDIVYECRAIYTEGRRIIEQHYDSFTPSEKASLQKLDRDLIILNNAWEDLSHTPSGTDITPLVKSISQVLTLVLKLVALAV